ncbi:MAG: photosystem II complex extrinsic protein PsbU [Cyanobacteria bacterium MAG CAR4_bin_6]|nr:photosystem II complex extrinsic protein PsbU [Cyanobacteria bacterium MAG CAR4_bin_6]
MKRFGTWLLAAVMAVGLLGTMAPKAAVAIELRNAADAKLAEQKKGLVDLNNASVRRFQQFPGMYPTLAGKIVVGGPYENVDDVLNLDLTQRQQELFEKYKGNFTVTDPELALNVGFDRINDGQYR